MINQNIQFVLSGSKNVFSSKRQLLFQLKQDILSKPLLYLKAGKAEMLHLEKNINNMSPDNVLKRGYSITLHNGKAIKSFKSVKEGDNIDTIVFEGNIRSIVKSSQKSIKP